MSNNNALDNTGLRIGDAVDAAGSRAGKQLHSELTALRRSKDSTSDTFALSPVSPADTHLPSLEMAILAKGRSGGGSGGGASGHGGERQPSEIRAGEGPYQAFSRLHPEWNHKQVLDAAHKFKEATGRSSFRKNEKIKLDESGAAVARVESSNGYTDTISKNGSVAKVVVQSTEQSGDTTTTTEDKQTGEKHIHSVDKKGNWTKKEIDSQSNQTFESTRVLTEDGKEIITEKTANGESRQRITNRDGSFVHVEKDRNGKTTAGTFDRNGNLLQVFTGEINKEGVMITNLRKSDGSYEVQRIQKDKSKSVTAGDAAGNITQTNYDSTGQVLNAERKRITETGTETMKKNNEGHVSTTTVSKDGSQTVMEIEPSGNFMYRESNAKSQPIKEVKRTSANGITEETERSADGSFKKRVQNTDGSRYEHEEDAAGNFTRINFDSTGKVSRKCVHAVAADGAMTDVEYDSTGKVLRSWERNRDGSPR